MKARCFRRLLLTLVLALVGVGGVCGWKAQQQHDPAIYYAVTEKRPHIAQALLEHGANVNQRDSLGATLLMRVAYVGDVEMTRFLLDHGASVSLADGEGQSALYYAVFLVPIRTYSGFSWRMEPLLTSRTSTVTPRSHLRSGIGVTI